MTNARRCSFRDDRGARAGRLVCRVEFHNKKKKAISYDGANGLNEIIFFARVGMYGRTRSRRASGCVAAAADAAATV